MKPVALYDDDCGFCLKALAVARRWRLDENVDFRPVQHEDLTPHGITLEQALRSMAAIDSAGRVHWGAQAWSLILRGRRLTWPLGALIAIPPFSWLAGLIYRLVADNRSKLVGGTPACGLPRCHRRPSP